MTWLYVFGIPFDELPELKWGPTYGKIRLEDGCRSAEHRRQVTRDRRNNGVIENRLGHKARARTPIEFQGLLIDIASQCNPSRQDLILQPALLALV